MYECWCDERLKTKSEGSTRLVYTGLLGGLEPLKRETRLIVENEWFVSVMGVMTVSYNSVYLPCVPLLCSVPFHVMTSPITLYHTLSPIPNTLYRCIRLYTKNQHGRVGRVCLFGHIRRPLN
jgi:hypothetical protein